MKKIQSMMLMLLVAVMGMCVQSCGSDDDNTPSGGYEKVGYVREDFNNTLKFQGKYFSEFSKPETVAQLSESDQMLLLNFLTSVKDADASLQEFVDGGATAADSRVLSTYKKHLENFISGKGFEGYIKITKTKNGDTSDVGTISFSK